MLVQQTTVLKAQAGDARRELLRRWTAERAAAGDHTFLLECDFDQDGLWSGLKDFLWEVICQLRDSQPALVSEHSYELAVVFPILRRKMKIRNQSLTDSGPADERTRNFSVDRAYRIVHGLIDLVEEWHRLHGRGPLAFACDNFDNAGSLVRRFFAEFLRRRGRELGVNALLAVAPDSGCEFLSLWRTPVEFDHRELPSGPPRSWPLDEMAQRADELERKALADTIELQIVLPELIRCLRQVNDRQRTVTWQAIAFGVYNHFGFYEDSFRYSQVVEDNLDYLSTREHPFFWRMTRWNLVGNLFGCFIGNNEFERACRVVTKEALEKIDNPVDLPRIHWVLAMLHTRYMPIRNFDLAAEHLEKGLAILETAAEMRPSQKHFLTTFLENGLALVRYRQGRAQEAIALCRTGYERLQTHLPPDKHRLHRSVLLYNMAQVYTSLDEVDAAIHYYTEAMAIDPSYSEYYNERGNLYLRKGLLEEAVADYRLAIELSSPYQEVWTNLGQAYRELGRHAEAVQVFNRAIDLDPQQVLSHVGRAQSHEALGNVAAALADYSRALDLDPRQPLVLANRAILHYEAGGLAESLADLDAALELSPDNPQLYENRAVLLHDLERHAEALRDLETCRQLYADPADRARVGERLATAAA